MKGDLPEELSPQVRDAARLLIEAARRVGWEIGPIRLRGGTISLSARSPGGGGFLLSCPESEFIDRLKSALSD